MRPLPGQSSSEPHDEPMTDLEAALMHMGDLEEQLGEVAAERDELEQHCRELEHLLGTEEERAAAKLGLWEERKTIEREFVGGHSLDVVRLVGPWRPVSAVDERGER